MTQVHRAAQACHWLLGHLPCAVQQLGGGAGRQRQQQLLQQSELDRQVQRLQPALQQACLLLLLCCLSLGPCQHQQRLQQCPWQAGRSGSSWGAR
jgi:hypothetical protein